MATMEVATEHTARAAAAFSSGVDSATNVSGVLSLDIDAAVAAADGISPVSMSGLA